MQFGDLALSKSEQADVGMPQSLVNRRHILLIATDAIQSLGNDTIKIASLGLLKERPHMPDMHHTHQHERPHWLSFFRFKLREHD